MEITETFFVLFCFKKKQLVIPMVLDIYLFLDNQLSSSQTIDSQLPLLTESRKT